MLLTKIIISLLILSLTVGTILIIRKRYLRDVVVPEDINHWNTIEKTPTSWYFLNHIDGRQKYSMLKSNKNDPNQVIHVYGKHKEVSSNDDIEMILVQPYHYLNTKETSKSASSIVKKSSKLMILDLEPNRIDDSIEYSDFAITTKKDICNKYQNATEYLPFYLPFLLQINHDISEFKTNHSRVDPNDHDERTEFCFFAYSNCDEKFKGVVERKKFYYKMQEMTNNRVSNYGKAYNNKSKSHSSTNKEFAYLSNKDLMKKFKFVIAIENEFIDGYVTEKLINPIISGCIPIYMGDPKVFDVFNKDRMISISDFDSYEECIEYVLKVEKDENLFKQIQSAPIAKHDPSSQEYKDDFSFLYGGKFYRDLCKKNRKLKKIIKPTLVSENNIKVLFFGEDNCNDLCKEFNYCKEYIKREKIDIDEILSILSDSESPDDILILCDSSCVMKDKSRQIINYFLELLCYRNDLVCFPVENTLDDAHEMLDLTQDDNDIFFTEFQISTKLLIMKPSENTINLFENIKKLNKPYETLLSPMIKKMFYEGKLEVSHKIINKTNVINEPIEIKI